jgi:hypothetical protein
MRSYILTSRKNCINGAKGKIGVLVFVLFRLNIMAF